ncbi:MAG TPA: acyl-CoA dehydrogenase family protein [Burkholderiaceae bacterium]
MSATTLSPPLLIRAASPLPSDGRPFDVEAATERLALALAATAVERDRAGGHAAAERALIRDSGLLALVVPREAGGIGADWPTLYRSVRRLAEVDSALAHVFAFHHLQIASILLFGNDEQRARLLGQTIRERLFWGNALNPLDPRLVAVRVEGGWQLDGVKSYASGSVGSDRLLFSARTPEPNAAVLIAQLATRTAGLEVREDWDSFGQRQTDSGTVRFEAVFLPDREVLQVPGTLPTPRSTLRQLISQLVMGNVYLGIARGAFDSAKRFTVDSARPWLASGVTRAADDPYVQHRYGELWLHVRAAQAVTDAAALALQGALDRGPALTAAERAEVAIVVAEAKVLTHRAAIEVSTQLFELTGARSTSEKLRLDRFWRNARVHTLHDPVDYKLRDIGRYRLDGRPPEPTPYS